MQDPLPAIREAEATGEAAALFADIRGVLGVGAVNLIWRHLATIPGALPWAWGALRPAYVDGRLATAAAALAEDLTPLALSPLPPGALPAEDARGIAAVQAAYARTNPLALLALTALQHPGPAVAPRAAVAPPPALPLPPLPETLPPAVEASVARLNGLGARPTEGHKPLLASMYRHLALWPDYLALAEQQLAPAVADGRLAAAILACRAAARVRAATLSIAADPPPEPAATRLALARFGDEVLPRMVVVCNALRRVV